MPQTLDTILPDTTIVDPKGKITNFFRLRWERLRTLIALTPDVASGSFTGLTAAQATTVLFVTKTPGFYRVSMYIRKTVADGVTSRVTGTIGWVENEVALANQFADFTVDSITAVQLLSVTLQVDAAVGITWFTTYASNTPNKMTYEEYYVVEQMA